MKIKNNDIYMTRGETGALSIRVWNEDGTPFILPPVNKRLLFSIADVKEVMPSNYRYTFRTPIRHSVNSSGKIVIKVEGRGRIDVHLQYTSRAESAVVDMYQSFTSTSDEREFELTVGTDAFTTFDIVSITTVATKISSISIGNIEYTANIAEGLVSVLALAVKAAENDAVVLSKYLNLSSAITCTTVYPVAANASVDRIPGGFNKFTEYTVYDFESVSSASSSLESKYRSNGIMALAKCGTDYYHLTSNPKYTYGFALAPYEFAVCIPFLFEDTQNLYNGDYIYDVTLYQGYVNSIDRFNDDQFPFDYEDVKWKKSIIDTHKFIVKESNNA